MVANVRVRGMPWLVAVDSFLPFHEKYKQFIFSKDANQYGWVPFLEKIWAKSNVNYHNVVGGDPLVAIDWLTGYPGFSYSLEYPTEEVKDS